MPGARRWTLPFPATDPPSEQRQRLLDQRRSDRRRLITLEGQFVPLLLAALAPILVMPFTAQPSTQARTLLAITFGLLIVQAFRTLPPFLAPPTAVARGRQFLFQALGVLTSAGLWIPVLLGGWPNGAYRVGMLVLLSLFLLLTSIRLVRLLARVPRVDAEVMAGAAAGYLLLGLTGGVIATATQVIVPGSFRLGESGAAQLLLDRLTYFSFITIAGLGYGDVVPGNAVGERFVILLSVSSTLYVALLVGLLLGRFIAAEEVEILEEVQEGSADELRGP